jgi:hypothetical protein
MADNGHELPIRNSEGNFRQRLDRAILTRKKLADLAHFDCLMASLQAGSRPACHDGRSLRQLYINISRDGLD